MKIVAPFRPFTPEIGHHATYGLAWWMEAIGMMARSAHAACQSRVHVLTDVDTDLPFRTLHYRTRERRLMLWYLEIAAAYLASADFNDDTVMLDSDQLVYGDLRRWFARLEFGVDLALLVRRPPKNGRGFPIINGVQFWPLRGRPRLVGFYRRALALARGMREPSVIWGADSEALEWLLRPAVPSTVRRAGLRVQMIEASKVSRALSAEQIRLLETTRTMPRPETPVLDFRNTRKRYMRQVFEATLPELTTR